MPPSRTRQKLWSASITSKPQHIDAFSTALDEDALSLSIFNPPRANTAKAEAIFSAPPNRAHLTAKLSIAAALIKTRAPDLVIRELPDLDWLEKVAADFPPLKIAGWTIYGARHKAAVANPRLALEIDATSAFGTGEHPTTRGCLLMLDKILKRKKLKCHPRDPPTPEASADECSKPAVALAKAGGGGPSRKCSAGVKHRRWMPACAGMTKKIKVLDMGSGTGILAMAAAKSNPCKALGIELDPQSVDIAKTNIARNGLRPRARVAFGNGYRARIVRQTGPYDLIMANIFARPLAQMAKDLKRHLKPGGSVILAGLLTHQANRVLAAHRMQKVYLVQRLKIGEWTILLLKRPESAGH